MQRKLSPRNEYLLQEKQRVNNSVSLLERFEELKALSIEIAFLDSDRIRHGEMKYTANLAHAKSVFRFSCPNVECVEGDFDLSAELANAISWRHTTASGELICRGWRSQVTMNKVSCHNILRYTPNLEYHAPAAADSIETKSVEPGFTP